MAIVWLRLRSNSQGGFDVLLRTNTQDIDGTLPPLPSELETSYTQWQLGYRQIDEVRSYIAPEPGVHPLRLTPKSIEIHSNQDHAEAVRKHLNEWLNCGDSKWQPIRDGLIAIAQQLHSIGEEISIILDADINLRRLPWQEWTVFQNHYPQAEIALRIAQSPNTTQKISSPESAKIRILVAIGRSDGINTEDDLEEIQRLEQLGAEVVYLKQPTIKELCDRLWDQQGYHIFIFTGHSGSDNNGQIGWIEVNDTESLQIEQFKEALKVAVSRGLQLAIFNSCDGLGLANQMAQLNLQQSIVMREPVPDSVAVEFLRHFFQQFSSNQSLFASVHTARKRLEHFNSDYPGAVWLPTICITPDFQSLTWQQLRGSTPEDTTPQPPLPEPVSKPTINKWLIPGLVALVVGGGITWWVQNQSQQVIPPQLAQPFQNFSAVQVPTGKFSYGGSTTWAPIRKVVDPEIKKVFPAFNITYKDHPTLKPGSGTGIKMVIDGELAFSQSSRTLASQEQNLAVSKGFKLKEVSVAEDAIAIAVHPSLTIPGLTIEQLIDIYTGKTTNWKDVGGPDIKIIPYSRPLQISGTTTFFKETILVDKNFGSNVDFSINTTTQAINKVNQSSAQGGIYYASASEILDQSQVKALPLSRNGGAFIKPQEKTYPLTRHLRVIIKQNNQLDEQAGEAYAKLLQTKQGQDLIKKALQEQ